MTVAAPQEAMRYYESALELLPNLPTAVRDEAALVRVTADAAAAAGHQFRAVSLVRDALSEIGPRLAPADRAELLYSLATGLLNVDVDDEALVAQHRGVGPGTARAGQRPAGAVGHDARPRRHGARAGRRGRAVGSGGRRDGHPARRA